MIVDEVHALAGTSAAHLAVSLERLDALLQAPAQRIVIGDGASGRRGGPIFRWGPTGGDRGRHKALGYYRGRAGTI